eukprot:gene9680-biopygen1598
MLKQAHTHLHCNCYETGNTQNPVPFTTSTAKSLLASLCWDPSHFGLSGCCWKDPITLWTVGLLLEGSPRSRMKIINV